MEFENLQIEVPTDSSQQLGVRIYEKKYHNRSKDFVIGFDPNSKEALERKKKRANRFGKKTIQPVTAPPDDLFSDTRNFLKIDVQALEWPPVPAEVNGEIRPDVIHLYGVESMSTTDVFDYFRLYGPETIEWIDDFSCNVVWDDKETVMTALDTLSKTYSKLLELQRQAAKDASIDSIFPPKPLLVKEEEEEDEVITHYENQIHVPEDPESVDPKGVWRIGLTYRKNQLFLRYATKHDRKLPGAAQRSEYYLKYGRNPRNTQNGVAGVLSASRKRKLKEMQKLAEERFRGKEPAVKIVELAELKAEGIISKMEVDDDEQPIFKRIHHDDSEESSHLTHERIPPMTMVADKVEVQQRLGDRYSADTIHDRLGTPPDDDKDDMRTTRGVHHRLGVQNLDHIARRNQKNDVRDARNEISSRRCKQVNNQTYVSGDGYIDENGDYHDTYRACDIKKEGKKEENDDSYGNYENRNTDNETRSRSPNGVRNRLGTPRHDLSSSSSDLRNKLRHRGGDSPEVETVEENIKEEEEDGDKVNLCIEIKQEIPEGPPGVDMDDADFDF